MEQRIKRRIKNALKLLLKVLIVVLYFTAFVKFFNVDDVCEKMEYGLSVIVFTILFFQ